MTEKIVEVHPDHSPMKVPVNALPHLKAIKIKVLSIANNHTMEYGSDSFYHMCDLLTANDFITVGHKRRPYEIINHRGNNIGVLSFSTIPALYGYEPEYYFLDVPDPDGRTQLLSQVREVKARCNYLIILPHWGYEFVGLPSEQQLELSKDLIAAGADIIVGAHPHIIQKAYFIHQTPVVFSAGNFISDYWQERIKRNLLVEINVEEKRVLLHELSANKNFVITPTNRNQQFDEKIE